MAYEDVSMQSQSEVKSSFKVLLFASLLTLALWFIPFAGALTYPIRLFVTFLHETGHALAALATLGGVNRVDLFWDGSGRMQFQGGWRWVVWTAGYLSTTVYGSMLLLSLRRERNAKRAAAVTGGLLLVITALFAGNLLAVLVGLGAGAGLLALSRYGQSRVTHFLMSFIAVQCLLNAFYDVRTLLFISAFDSTLDTDARFMAEATGVPSIVWAVGWAVLSALVLGATLLVYYRSLKTRAAIDDEPPSMLLPELPSLPASKRL
jgi:hypothetical protein